MSKVDMSPKGVTTRLKRLSQLRRLGLSLTKAKTKQRSEAAGDSTPVTDANSAENRDRKTDQNPKGAQR